MLLKLLNKNRLLSLSLILISIYPVIKIGNEYTHSYFLFSITSHLFLMYSILQNQSIFIKTTGILLWLGFWCKFTINFIFHLPFTEPTGSFVSNSTNINHILLITSFTLVALTGVAYIILKTIPTYRFSKISAKVILKSEYNHTKYLVAILISYFALSFLNNQYGIQQAGLFSKTILPYPLNAIIYFMLSSGFNIIIMFLIYPMIIEGKKSLTFYNIVLCIAGVISISLLSRFQFILIILPLIIFYFYNIDIFNLKKKVYLVLTNITIIVATLFFTFISISKIRANQYFVQKNTTKEVINLKTSVQKIKHLLINRWVGIEGLMSTYSYDRKSPSKLIELLTEKPKIGKTGMYQHISKSKYVTMITDKHNPAAVPGPIGLLAISNSSFIVIVGASLIYCVFFSIELITYKTLLNPLLTIFIGIQAAFNFANFGLGFLNLLKTYTLIGLLIFTLFLIPQFFFHKLYKKI